MALRTLMLALAVASLAVPRAIALQPSGPQNPKAPPAADTLSQARRHYNSAQYEEAIRLAAEVVRTPTLADAALVVSGRSHLERYRHTSEQGDLAAARTELRRVDDTKLSPRDHVELLIGLGELLYFDTQFSAAAEFFEVALARLELLDADTRETLLEWWANALSQQAELSAEVERRPLYARVLRRMDDELKHDDRSAVASYWITAAARGAGELERAWAAAMAGWVRAPLTNSAATKLRADLDRLMMLVIIPERAVQLSPTDPRAAVPVLQQQWQEFKDKYKD